MARAQSFPTDPAYRYCWPHWDGGTAWDIQAPAGTDVLAVFDGTAYDRSNTAAGHIIDLVADDGWTVRYGHLSDLTIRSGDRVRAGQLIGHVGCTGTICQSMPNGGPHLHLAVTRGPMHADGNGDVPPCEWLEGVEPNPAQSPITALSNLVAGGAAGIPGWAWVAGLGYLVWSLADDL